MRILQVAYSSNIAGGEMVLHDISRKLVAKGHQVFAAIPGPGPLKEFLEAQGIIVYETGPHKSYDLKGAFNIYRLVKTLDIELVHAHGMMVSVPARLAVWTANLGCSLLPNLLVSKKKVKCISTTHITKSLWKKADNPGDEIKRHYYILADNITSMMTEGTVAVSHAVRSDLLHQGMRPDLVRVIQNGIDFDKYSKKSDNPVQNKVDTQSKVVIQNKVAIQNKITIQNKTDIRKKCHASEKDILIGMVGRLSPQKGVDIMIKAAALAVKNRKSNNLKFAIAGDGPLKQELEALVEKQGVSSCFTFLGNIDYIPDFLSSIDIFTLTSNWEGLPLVVLEAMAAGKPVAATSVDGTPEVIQHGINGYLVEKGDFKGFADIWVKMADNMALSIKMGQNGKTLVDQKYRDSRMVDDYITLYKELLDIRENR